MGCWSDDQAKPIRYVLFSKIKTKNQRMGVDDGYCDLPFKWENIFIVSFCLYKVTLTLGFGEHICLNKY